MAFHDVRFPTDISYGSSGGPGFNTKIVSLASGAEQRVAQWGAAQRKYDVSYGVKSVSQLSNLQSFFIAREGAAHGFRYKDFLDYTSNTIGNVEPQFHDVSLGTATGSSPSEEFQVVKRYTSGATTFVRNITKLVAGRVFVGINGSNTPSSGGSKTWTVDLNNGKLIINGLASGDTITCGYEFDVPVRFSDSADQLMSMSLEDFSGGSTSVELVELIGEGGETPQDFFYGGFNNLGAISADVSLSVSSGRVVEIAPTSSYNINFPTNTNLPGGGPYFYIINSGSAAVTLQTSPTYSLAANKMAMVVLSKTSAGAKAWKVIP